MVKKIFGFIWKVALWFFGLSIVSVVIFRFVPVPVTPLMLIRCVEQVFSSDELRLKHDWVSIDEISKNLPLAVVCSEDQNFLNHSGFDLEAIQRSVDAAKRGAKRVWVPVLFRSKQQRMYFSGLAEAGFAKDSRFILRY